MGILDQAGSQTLSGSWVVKSGQESENDSVLFEDTRGFEEFVPGTDSEDRITFPTMPAELENYGTEIDPQDLLPNLSSFGNGMGELDEGFFPVTPDVPRRGNSSIGLGTRELMRNSGSPHSRMSTGNLRSKYRPRDNILMAGPMDLVTITQETGAQGLGGLRSASVRPRDQLSFPGEMELLSSHTDYSRGGHGTERRGSCQPKNHLKLDGSVEYRTNSHDFKGTTSSRSEIEKPRNHLQSTGNLELKTTTSEAFLADRRAEKMEKIKRDNLTISGDRILRTTHNDFKHFGNISSSEIRAIPPWFSEPKSKQIIIS